MSDASATGQDDTHVVPSGRVRGLRIAAWQMPIAAMEADDALAALSVPVRRCEEAGVSVLCCPEAAVGGLADYAAEPEALAIATADVDATFAPVASSRVTAIVGFTERGDDGRQVDGLTFGVVICNDSNYIEPARVMAAKGATVLFVPTNNVLPPDRAYEGSMARPVASGPRQTRCSRVWRCQFVRSALMPCASSARSMSVCSSR